MIIIITQLMLSIAYCYHSVNVITLRPFDQISQKEFCSFDLISELFVNRWASLFERL